MDSTRPPPDPALARRPAIGGRARRQRVFLRGLRLDAAIGVHAHEKGRRQPVRVTIEVDVAANAAAMTDALADALCYETLAAAATDIVSTRHFNLVETLAEEIAARVLAHPLALKARVCVEKPEAIGNAEAAGVEIDCEKPD